MSDERIFLTPDEAIAMLDIKEGRVHAFLNPGGMLIGADYDEADAIDEITQAKTRERAGLLATSMKHALAVNDGKRFIYFATKPTIERELERVVG